MHSVMIIYRCSRRRRSKADLRLEISNVTPTSIYSTPSSNGKDEPLDVEEKTIDQTDQAVFQSTAYCEH